MNKYDVIVVGAGHAGIEAALAASRMGAKTVVFVIKIETIGMMSCNPTIGGPAKGHLAREIDTIGGEIAKTADLSGIQFRMLNKKKGEAVWAPRSQNDRVFYSMLMRESLEKQHNLDVKEALITELLIDDKEKSIQGIQTKIGEKYYAPKVILANGTFLRGKVHIGNINFSSGRSGEPASKQLALNLKKSNLNIKRFKTGTPPRIDLRTVNLNLVKKQPGDKNPTGFSFYRNIELKNKVDCYLTFTNPSTHRFIHENLNKSSLYGGYINGVGPRYCPSIEDKVVKFKDKNRHQVFIEPEGMNTFEAYVNGVSNSLPPHIQQKMIHSIKGLENASIMRYGYAIEYDYIDPSEITLTLETKKIKGLYLTGQINGTSGYEEAAAQGLAAGINAVLSLDKKEPLHFDRSNSYIGVLIDDLVTKGTNEPYRLFTSRAEYRLFLRQDNADERLMPIGYKLGLVSQNRWEKFQKKLRIFKRELKHLQNHKCKKNNGVSPNVSFYQLLKRPEIEFKDLTKYGYTIPPDLNETLQKRLHLEAKYEGYLKRQKKQIKKFKKLEHKKIPKNINFMKIKTMSYEAREKMQKIEPVSLGQASRISGIAHPDITALMVYLKKAKENSDNEN